MSGEIIRGLKGSDLPKAPSSLLPTTILDDGHTFVYDGLNLSDLDKPGFLPKEFYSLHVETVVQCCDIIVLRVPEVRSGGEISEEEILLVERQDPPAKGLMWPPGGRMEKYNSVAESAKEKCRKEVGIEVEVLAIVHAAATAFKLSNWKKTHSHNE